MQVQQKDLSRCNNQQLRFNSTGHSVSTEQMTPTETTDWQ